MARQRSTGSTFLLPGFNIPVLSLLGLAILAMLFVIVSVIFTSLKKVITSSVINEFRNKLLAAGYKEPLAGYVAAQAAHETGGFISFIYLFNKNAFGMKYAGQRNAAGEKNGYAYYDTIEQCIEDHKAWIIRHIGWVFTLPRLVSLEKYVNLLKQNSYFEDTVENYLNGVEYYYSTIKIG